jgi:hypothetical protein
MRMQICGQRRKKSPWEMGRSCCPAGLGSRNGLSQGHVSPIGPQTNDRMCIGLRQKETCIEHLSYHEFMTTPVSIGKDTGGSGLVYKG